MKWLKYSYLLEFRWDILNPVESFYGGHSLRQ